MSMMMMMKMMMISKIINSKTKLTNSTFTNIAECRRLTMRQLLLLLTQLRY